MTDIDWLLKTIGGAMALAFGGFIFRTEGRIREHALRLDHLETQAEADRRETLEYRKEMRDVVRDVQTDVKDILKAIPKA
jgi:hypothetical protein